MTALSDEQRRFLAEPRYGVATTLRADGSPHSTVVWVENENGELSFNTATGRAKERHLEADSRVSLLVVDPQNAYQWVAVSGRGELTRDDADPQIDRLAKKYLGKDEYPWRTEAEQRIKVTIEPEHVSASGFDG